MGRVLLANFCLRVCSQDSKKPKPCQVIAGSEHGRKQARVLRRPNLKREVRFLSVLGNFSDPKNPRPRFESFMRGLALVFLFSTFLSRSVVALFLEGDLGFFPCRLGRFVVPAHNARITTSQQLPVALKLSLTFPLAMRERALHLVSLTCTAGTWIFRRYDTIGCTGLLPVLSLRC